MGDEGVPHSYKLRAPGRYPATSSLFCRHLPAYNCLYINIVSQNLADWHFISSNKLFCSSYVWSNTNCKTLIVAQRAVSKKTVTVLHIRVWMAASPYWQPCHSRPQQHLPWGLPLSCRKLPMPLKRSELPLKPERSNCEVITCPFVSFTLPSYI